MGAKREVKIVTVPANGQISIGRKYAGVVFQVEELGNGQILLRKGTFTPDSKKTTTD